MNTLLVYPKCPDNSFWSFKYALRFISKKAAFPPLGLLTVAAMLPKKWNFKLIDMNVNQLTDKDIAWADTVFISAMIAQKSSAQDVINKCKTQGKIVVAGGPVFTTQHERFNGVDHVIIGEAEATLPRFLKDLEREEARHIYSSVERPDITKTPIPLWPLINLRDYAAMLVQYSRGCPHLCKFCDIEAREGRIPRPKTIEQFIREIQSLHNAGWRRPIFFVDDNIIGNKKKLKKMLRRFIEWQIEHNYPFKIYIQASVDIADDEELMELLITANVYKVFLGIETPSVESLKECDKHQNVKRNLEEAVRAIQRRGMQVMAGFIVGFDSDEESIFETLIEFIQKTGIATAMLGMLNALPLTRLYQQLEEEGRLLTDTTGENTDGILDFVPKMGAEELIEGYKKTISILYSPRYYYRRIDTFVKNYRPTVKGGVSRGDLRALIISVWKIGIISRSRWLYWKLAVKTCLTKIKALPMIIELVIYGQHFEKVADNINKKE